MRLEGKVTIITGGGSGMGRTASELFAREGARVVVADFSEAAGEETVALVRAGGGEASFVKADVSDESDARGMVRWQRVHYEGVAGTFRVWRGLIGEGRVAAPANERNPVHASRHALVLPGLLPGPFRHAARRGAEQAEA